MEAVENQLIVHYCLVYFYQAIMRNFLTERSFHSTEKQTGGMSSEETAREVEMKKGRTVGLSLS